METSSNHGAQQPPNAHSRPACHSPYLLACTCWQGLQRAPEPCQTCQRWARLFEFRSRP